MVRAGLCWLGSLGGGSVVSGVSGQWLWLSCEEGGKPYYAFLGEWFALS